MPGPYPRPSHTSGFNDGSSTDATVLMGELETSVEELEGSVATPVPNAAQALTNLGAESSAHASATYVPRELVWPGTPADANSSYIGLEHDGGVGYLLHLTSGPSMTGGAIFAVGIGDGGATAGTGFLVSQKAASSGDALSLVNQAGTTGRSFYGGHAATGSPGFMVLESLNSTGVASPLLSLTANGVPGTAQVILQLASAAASLSGRGGFGTSLLKVYADTGTLDVQGPLLQLNGAVLQVQETDTGQTGTSISKMRVTASANDVQETYYRWSGSASLWYANRLATINATELALQNATGAAAVGAHTFVTALRSKQVSGAAGLGFFGAAPIAQPTGTPVAATDLASVITLANSLRTNLLALGLVA